MAIDRVSHANETQIDKRPHTKTSFETFRMRKISKLLKATTMRSTTEAPEKEKSI